jgi:SPP1 family predicted phage head-tail adaptor
MLTENNTLDFASLRHFITIQKRSDSPDQYGQPNTSWVEVTTAWASITAVTSRETYQAQQLNSQVTHSIVMRYQPVSITAGMQVKYGTKTFDVQAVDNVEQRNAILKLLVLELTV